MAVDFARRYELLAKDEASKLNLAEVDPIDMDALEGAIPRCILEILTAGRTCEQS
jgi:hypothetical protein